MAIETLATQEYKIELGIHNDIAEEDYHKSPGISKHGLDLINRSPAHYKNYVIEETPALVFGGAFHTIVLEPKKFNEKYAVSPFDDFRTKQSKEWKQEQSDNNLRVISKDDYKLMVEMEQAIRKHKYASILLDPDSGIAEQSAYWIDNNKENWKNETPTFRLCRCRVDFNNTAHSILVDLKTTRCAGYSSFARDVTRFRYHVQDAFYTDGMRLCGARVKKFVFVGIEKEPPYAIGCYEIDADDRAFGRTLYQRDMLTYHKAMTEKEWPAYDPEIRVIQLPRWSRNIDIY